MEPRRGGADAAKPPPPAQDQSKRARSSFRGEWQPEPVTKERGDATTGSQSTARSDPGGRRSGSRCPSVY